MLTKGTYRTEISISFELSKVYTAPVVRLWWMIVVCNDFRFSEFGLGLSVTLPHGSLNGRATSLTIGSLASFSKQP
jgi:hypothetical protein